LIVNVVILLAVALQRLGELWLSNRHTRVLLAQGAHEVGASHYPLIVAVHTLWLAALWWLGLNRPIDGFWLGVFVLIELARIWVLASLGSRWTTRIIILPEAPLIRRGPYRWVTHPNYLVVIAEIAVLPLVFGLWPVAIIFSAFNAAVLTVRIREENRALRG
jgi:methyltransferase